MWCVVLFVLLFICTPVSSQILLNEIYYDHPGRDDGYEFIELINTAPVAYGLDGHALEFHDGSAEGWRIIWQAASDDSVMAGGLFVLGGDAVAPAPHEVLDLNLQNGPDAVRLVREGTEVDRVGYGALSDPQYFEGQAAPDVPEGFSLGRYPDGNDSNDNSVDFRRLTPSPGRFNRARHDVALRHAASTAKRASLRSPAEESVRLRIVNRGILPIATETVVLSVDDSTEAGIERLATTTNSRDIAPADSLEVAIPMLLGFGYHHVSVVAHYEADDRWQNNGLEFLRRVGEPALLVSEVMSYPTGECPEYVELLNVGNDAYPFEEHGLRDAAHEAVPVGPLEYPMAAGGLVVVTADREALLRYFPALDPGDVVEIHGSWPSLNHSGGGGFADSVIVLDRFRLPVDRVAYPPQPGDTRGTSLERLDLYPGDREHTWVLSTSAGGGSPGERNPTGIVRAPKGNAVTIHPNPFDPSTGETLRIVVPAKSVPTRSVVQVFDVTGRRLVEIGSTSQLPFVFTWDGRDEQGQWVPSGIYVLACEFFAIDTGKRTVEKVVLGRGGKNR